MNCSRGGRRRASELGAISTVIVSLLLGACATVPPDEIGEEELSLCAGIDPSQAHETARHWVIKKYNGLYQPFEWEDLYEGTDYFWMHDGEFLDLYEEPARPYAELVEMAGCILTCWAWPRGQMMMGGVETEFVFLFRQGRLVSARQIDHIVIWGR